MKYFKLKLFALLFAVITVSSCEVGSESDDNCYSSGYVPATAVTGPEESVLGDPVVFSVTFKVLSTCGDFVRFDETADFPKQVGARVSYSGCKCEEKEIFFTRQYTYVPVQPGEYEFKFLSGTNQYITKTVTITE